MPGTALRPDGAGRYQKGMEAGSRSDPGLVESAWKLLEAGDMFHCWELGLEGRPDLRVRHRNPVQGGAG